jgi:hypothetical protein
MTKQMKWKRIGLAGILTVSLAGLPQFAAAADRYDRQSRYNSGGYQSNYGGADQGYGDDNPRGNYRESRDREYRNSGNWNSSYYKMATVTVAIGTTAITATITAITGKSDQQANLRQSLVEVPLPAPQSVQSPVVAKAQRSAQQ